VAKLEERQEYIFHCGWCNHYFNRSVTPSEVGMVVCPISCGKNTVKEVTKEWLSKRDLRRKQKESRLIQKAAEENRKESEKTREPQTKEDFYLQRMLKGIKNI
jgi:uncharacterized Zn finger protein (UPF0148 family)